MFSRFIGSKKKKKTDDDTSGLSDGADGKSASKNAEDKADHGLETAQLMFTLQCDDSLIENTTRKEVLQAFLDHIKEKNMVQYYEYACEHGVTNRDAALVKEMQEANKKEEKVLAEKEKDAAENHGEIEVMEALLATASFKALTGTKQEALTAYDKVAGQKSMSTG